MNKISLLVNTLYIDPNGRLYVVDTPPATKPLPPSEPPKPKTPSVLRLLPDEETAAILSNAATSQPVPPKPLIQTAAPPSPGAPVFQDAADSAVTFVVGMPYPALQYGELVRNIAGSYFAIELDGRRWIPDIQTLGSLGLQATDAQAISDHDAQMIPAGPSYLPVFPANPIVVRAVSAPGVFLYSMGKVDGRSLTYKQQLVGTQTIRYYIDQYGEYGPVESSELDAVPFGTPDQLEVYLAKQLVLVEVRCGRTANPQGADDVVIRACVNNPPAQPPTVSSFNTILHSASLSSGATASPADLQLFAGVITVGVELPNAWTFLEQDGQQVSQNGFLNCPEAELFFDTDLFDVGDHVLTFGAQGNVSGPGSPSFPVEYQVMIRIEATLDAKGKTIALTPSQFPNNIYRIKHFFVLMLENRSFDHMFAANDDLRSMLTEATVNPLSSPSGSAQFRVSPPDPLAAIDPSHDIGNVLFQLVGTGASLATGGLEPPPPNPLQAQHFIDDFKGVNSVVSCMDPAQGAAYALNELAENFLVLERWHSSLPGPTWPNRFFLHCGTSGGIAYSPDDLGTPGIVDFTTGDGFHFKNGSIFDRLTKLGIPWRIYHDGNAQVWALQGLSPLDDFAANAPLLDVTIRDTIVSWLLSNTTPDKVADITELVGELLPIVFALFVTTGPLSLVAMFAVAEEIYWVVHQFCGKDLTVDGGNERDFSAFSGDVADGGYQPFYTFIEPNQGESNGNSGHPNYGDEALSEDLIARIYESLRASPMWSAGECALLIVYDEHGGIYDRVTPPSDPGYNPHDDEYRTTYDSQLDALGVDQLHDQFDFSLLGVRVPAVLISPYTSRAHGGPAPSTTTIYEHSSVVRTLQRRVQDPNYLSTRVAFTQDLYAVFGTTPLAPGDTDLSPKALTKYKKPEMHRAARPSPARSIPARSSPNVNFMLDRAAELAYRCELATDPTILGQIVANVRTLPTPAARLAAVKEALGARLQAHRDARAKLQTMSDANGYLADADVALAEYRKRVAALDASYKATWNQRSIKDKYTAFRAMVTATARRPS